MIDQIVRRPTVVAMSILRLTLCNTRSESSPGTDSSTLGEPCGTLGNPAEPRAALPFQIISEKCVQKRNRLGVFSDMISRRCLSLGDDMPRIGV